MALVGTVPLQINNRPAITVINFEHSLPSPTRVGVGGYGPFGTAKPYATGTGRFQCRIRADSGPEFPVSEIDQTFRMSYPLGPARFQLLNCEKSNVTVSVNQEAADTTYSVEFTYQELKQSK